MKSFVRRLVRSPSATVRVGVLGVSLLLYGSTGFLYFELPTHPDLGWLDAVWYAVVTVTTVGYGDFAPTTWGGRFLVAMPLMFFGIGLLGYVLSVAATGLIQSKTQELHGMGHFKFSKHLVLVHFPDQGKIERMLLELAGDPSFGRGTDLVLVDEDLAELPPALVARGVHFVRGNPARDDTLSRANIDAASYAVVLSKRPGEPSSDGLSVSAVLAIKARAAKVVTVGECVDPGAEELLRKAGCDRVVCTEHFDAHILSHEILNPGIQEVLEELTTNQSGHQQLFLTPFEGASLAFGKVVEACQRRRHLAVGIRRGSSSHLNPAADFQVQAGDQVISVGPERIARLGEA